MATMSAEYWTTPASESYESMTDEYYNRGTADALAGVKPNLKEIPQQYRYLYMSAYKRSK